MSLFQFIEKAESREKERIKEEIRKQKRIEASFRNMLKQAAPPIDTSTEWNEVRRMIVFAWNHLMLMFRSAAAALKVKMHLKALLSKLREKGCFLNIKKRCRFALKKLGF